MDESVRLVLEVPIDTFRLGVNTDVSKIML